MSKTNKDLEEQLQRCKSPTPDSPGNEFVDTENQLPLTWKYEPKHAAPSDTAKKYKVVEKGKIARKNDFLSVLKELNAPLKYMHNDIINEDSVSLKPKTKKGK
jgi:hypothetical protein